MADNQLIFNGIRIRGSRDPHREGQGTVWLSIRDILSAAGIDAGTGLRLDILTARLGEGAVVQRRCSTAFGEKYDMNFIRADRVVDLLDAACAYRAGIIREIESIFNVTQRKDFNVIELTALQAPVAQPSAPAQGTPEFDFKGQKVRVVMIEGEPWFVAKDVCLTLGMKQHTNGGYSHLLHKFAAGSEKQNILRHGAYHNPNLWSGEVPQTRILSVISESGLYKLVMRSDKPEAKAFQDWVTREVLPSIRKTGSYSVAPPPAASPRTVPVLSDAGSIETAFQSLVKTRLDRTIRRIQELNAEVKMLTHRSNNDRQLLELL